MTIFGGVQRLLRPADLIAVIFEVHDEVFPVVQSMTREKWTVEGTDRFFEDDREAHFVRECLKVSISKLQVQIFMYPFNYILHFNFIASTDVRNQKNAEI